MIWLLRHGEAEDEAETDAARRLTPKGERQARAGGSALAVLGADIGVCLTSPKLRARDTALIACEQLDVDVTEEAALAGGDFDPAALAEQAAAGGDVLMVGHDPDFSRAIEGATGARVGLKKGGLAAIHDGVLVTLLRPAQLGAIAGVRGG
jgi:phosphohistidine phosphatase